MTMTEKIRLVLQAYSTLQGELENIDTELMTLEFTDRANATEYWREDKYLYLIHSTDENGERKREYIGADPVKIEQAQYRITAHRLYCDLTKRRQAINYKLSAASYQLDLALYSLNGKQRDLWGNDGYQS